MDDFSQIPADISKEGAKTGKKVVKELAKTLGRVAGQVVGKKPQDTGQIVEELKQKDQEFKRKAEKEILARLQTIREEEARLRKGREQEKKDWMVIQKQKLTPPQIQRPAKAPTLPQVAKQRTETRVGWGAG